MDKYKNFAELFQHETEGLDYQVRLVTLAGARAAIIAPHGGAIEPGTSEIALKIAGDSCNVALFEGLKAQHNRDLHVTSTRFDHPEFLSVVRHSEFVVALHGERSDTEVVFVGGADEELAAAISATLEAAGFCTQKHLSAALQGVSPENICNKGSTGKGVQFELARGLRRKMFQSLSSKGRASTTETFDNFISAVRTGLASAGAL